MVGPEIGRSHVPLPVWDLLAALRAHQWGRLPSGHVAPSRDRLSSEPECRATRLAPELRLDPPIPGDDVAAGLDLLALARGTPALMDYGQLRLRRVGGIHSDVDVHDGLRTSALPC